VEELALRWNEEGTPVAGVPSGLVRSVHPGSATCWRWVPRESVIDQDLSIDGMERRDEEDVSEIRVQVVERLMGHHRCPVVDKLEGTRVASPSFSRWDSPHQTVLASEPPYAHATSRIARCGLVAHGVGDRNKSPSRMRRVPRFPRRLLAARLLIHVPSGDETWIQKSRNAGMRERCRFLANPGGCNFLSGSLLCSFCSTYDSVTQQPRRVVLPLRVSRS
jgi:hypothetical protein